MSRKSLWLAIVAVAASLVLLSGCGKSQTPKPPVVSKGPSTATTEPKSTPTRLPVVPPQHWFEGGNLHKSTVAQWRRATYDNKVATASDWLASTKWKGRLNSPSDFDRLNVKSQMLANGVDQTILGVEEIDSLQIREIAASLIVLSNDLGP